MGSSPAETWNSFYPMAECCVVEVYILSFYMKLSVRDEADAPN